MERKPNTTCKICGKQYYHCKDCETFGSWRLVACSAACYSEWLKQIEARDDQLNTPVDPPEIKLTDKRTLKGKAAKHATAES